MGRGHGGHGGPGMGGGPRMGGGPGMGRGPGMGGGFRMGGPGMPPPHRRGGYYGCCMPGCVMYLLGAGGVVGLLVAGLAMLL